MGQYCCSQLNLLFVLCTICNDVTLMKKKTKAGVRRDKTAIFYHLGSLKGGRKIAGKQKGGIFRVYTKLKKFKLIIVLIYPTDTKKSQEI